MPQKRSSRAASRIGLHRKVTLFIPCVRTTHLSRCTVLRLTQRAGDMQTWSSPRWRRLSQFR
eukprot:7200207-Prymnesium_polylepis.1